MRFQTILGSAATLFTITASAQSDTCTSGTRVINGRTCTVQCGIDRPGGDYNLAHTQSWELCIEQCAADPICVTAQYHISNGFCYFKNTVNNAVANDDNDSVDCGPKAAAPALPTCNYANTDEQGVGGCPSSCYCDSSNDGGDYCTQAINCGNPCAHDSDCGAGAFCTNRSDAVEACGGPICESTSGCAASGTKRRSIFGENAGSERFKRVAEIRARWEEKRAVCSRVTCQNQGQDQDGQ